MVVFKNQNLFHQIYYVIIFKQSFSLFAYILPNNETEVSQETWNVYQILAPNPSPDCLNEAAECFLKSKHEG